MKPITMYVAKRLPLLIAISAVAYAAGSVTVNGIRYTCSNECIVNVTENGYAIEDCCGGIVRFVL